MWYSIYNKQPLKMNTQSLNFPVLSLNRNITNYIMEIAGSEIISNLKSGLHNEIKLIDIKQSITNPAEIARLNFENNECEVTLSAAFCQFVWFMCDILLKLTDRSILQKEAYSLHISLNRFIKSSLKALKQQKIAPDINQFYECIESFGRPTFNSRILEEALLCDKLVSGSRHLAMQPFQHFPPKGKYEERVNSVYCFAISLILLHERGHYDLGHLANERPHMSEEIEADQSAFWPIYLHETQDKKFSMICGILLGFFSILMLNPDLEPDGVHQNEITRLNKVYNSVKADNPKYTTLYESMMQIWTEYRKNVGNGIKNTIAKIIQL